MTPLERAIQQIELYRTDKRDARLTHAIAIIQCVDEDGKPEKAAHAIPFPAVK